MIQQEVEDTQESTESQLISFLQEIGVKYEWHEHKAVFTCNEAKEMLSDSHSARTKNLFLRNKKGDRHFLVVVLDSQGVDLRGLGVSLGVGKLGFASSERLQKYLGVASGSVSLLALFNTEPNSVEIFIDEQVWKSEQVQAHPLRNTATLVISTLDLSHFLKSLGHSYQVLRIPESDNESM